MPQLINLSENEMLALWKRQMHIDVVRRECSVERDDGVDLDDLLLTRLRQWYAHLLASAPLQWLPVEDLRTEVLLSVSADGVVTAMKPERCVRPVEWRLAGWAHSVTDFCQPGSPRALAQQRLWTRSGCADPVIVCYDNRLVMYSLPEGAQPVLMMARCVAVPENNRYIFHHDALSTLPRWDEAIGPTC
ncbi:MAG: hypothetical protein J6S96_02645 [Muribaculaceae bacterium]|nr:hypothetical protein [Muribaculaceae bacterium]